MFGCTSGKHLCFCNACPKQGAIVYLFLRGPEEGCPEKLKVKYHKSLIFIN